MDYTSVQALRKWSNISSTVDDTVLVAIITAASRAIEKYCGRKFAADTPASHIFTSRWMGSNWVSPFDGNVLYLDDDLAEVPTSVTGSPAVTYLPANETPYYAIVMDTGSWDYPITVTGYWAYSRIAPVDIELACLRLSKWMYELRETTRGDAAIVTDVGAVLLPAGLPADVITLLAPYKRVRLAK